MNEKIRIFLADDHKMLRESLIMLLSQEEDFEITGQAALRLQRKSCLSLKISE